ncbi:MAG: hemolysin III family protein [Pirellulales bacterium]|nr:hemolysin III family protein [Pirellulales bacterium]
MLPIEVEAIPGFREPVSSLSHLLAIPFFLVAGYFLIRKGRGSLGRTVSLAIMAASTVALLTVSTIYHIQDEQTTARYVFWQLDMAGIFVLIAGTVTPVHMILFRGFHRWVPIALIWLAAAVGITLRNLYAEELMTASDALFVLMGWGGSYSCIILWKRYGFPFVRPLLIGGLAYTLGVVCITWRNWPDLVPGVVDGHALWHFATLIGLAFHWKFVFQFAQGRPAEA